MTWRRPTTKVKTERRGLCDGPQRGQNAPPPVPGSVAHHSRAPNGEACLVDEERACVPHAILTFCGKPRARAIRQNPNPAPRKTPYPWPGETTQDQRSAVSGQPDKRRACIGLAVGGVLKADR